MNWKTLDTIEQLEEIKQNSFEKTQLIFKHSTRCIISKMALQNFERNYEVGEGAEAYFLDLIAHRSVSNAVAEVFHIEHQSPQLLIIKEGKVVFHESHEGIDASDVKKYV